MNDSEQPIKYPVHVDKRSPLPYNTDSDKSESDKQSIWDMFSNTRGDRLRQGFVVKVLGIVTL